MDPSPASGSGLTIPLAGEEDHVLGFNFRVLAAKDRLPRSALIVRDSASTMTSFHTNKM